MNRLVGWTMDYALQRGLYPVAPGSHMVFLNRHVDAQGAALVPRPSAVIVAGLGAEGSLQAAELIRTVRLAVIGWARRFSEEPGAAKTFELASTLIGSGGTGITAGHAADLIIQGVLEANELIERERSDARTKVDWPRCAHLRLIELYLDRAADAWRALQLRQIVKPNTFALTATVEAGQGGHKRPPDSGYRGAPYDFITVDTRKNEGGARTFEFTLDSRRARSEVRGKTAQGQLLGELVATASSDQNRDQRIGRTLANLLVPIELEGYLAGTSGIQMALDPDSAAIPWELLDLAQNEDPNEEPWAIRVKLLRKLKLEEFRQHVIDADKDANVLVIGEPLCGDDFPRLEGARTEAICVSDTLAKSGDLGPKLTRLVADTPLAARPDAHAIVNALFEKDWRIVHIAGHGMPGEGHSPGGVVLSNGTFLGPDEIKSMRVVPELVFVNCCYLGQVGDTRRSRPYDRARFASGVAGALIDIGVRCVIAAGWAVDDAAATDFATTFYDGILRGDRFIDAVGQARRVAWEQHRDVNTWAAYQCYGDADWRFQPKAPDANQVRTDDREFSGIATDVALDLELERIYIETKFQGADRATQVVKLQKIEQRFAPIWGHKGRIAEGFGRAYAEAGAMDRAKSWYERAKTAPDGSASISAAEQLGNVQSRSGWELVERAVRERDQMQAQADSLAAKDAGRDASRKSRCPRRAEGRATAIDRRDPQRRHPDQGRPRRPEGAPEHSPDHGASEPDRLGDQAPRAGRHRGGPGRAGQAGSDRDAEDLCRGRADRTRREERRAALSGVQLPGCRPRARVQEERKSRSTRSTSRSRPPTSRRGPAATPISGASSPASSWTSIRRSRHANSPARSAGSNAGTRISTRARRRRGCGRPSTTTRIWSSPGTHRSRRPGNGARRWISSSCCDRTRIRGSSRVNAAEITLQHTQKSST